MSKGLVDIILDQIFDAEWQGRRGEKLTERDLNWVKLFGRSGKVLRNVYVPKGDSQTSEIDVLFITQKGIFVIESKNYSGWIFGSEADQNWTVSFQGGRKERFYNPILQNRSHITWLNRYLADATPLFSIVVFSERCQLKKVTVESDDVRVIKRDRVYATVREIWDGTADVLDDAAIEALYERLRPLTNVDAALKAAHIADIEKRYKGKPLTRTQPEAGKHVETSQLTLEPSVATAAVGVPGVCPRCGSPLVLRTAKKGLHAGRQFYGCSNFPNCRFTKGVE